MFKNKLFFVVLALASLTGIIMAQVVRYTDDRELFIGVPTASATIRPNVMIMADVSGSMSQSIYHPDFDRTKLYSRMDPNNASSTALPAPTNLSTYFVKTDGDYPVTYMPYSGTSTYTREFRICRPLDTITVYDARGMVSSTASVSGHSTWRRWNLSSSSNNFQVNQIIDYTGVDNLPHKTKIKQVYSQTRLYIDKNYESTYKEPKLNIYFYVNRRTIPNPNSAVSLINKGATCDAGYNDGYDVKLYTVPKNLVYNDDYNPPYEEVDPSRLCDFDINYLYWLFYWATPTQIADVTTWSNTFQFPDSKTGVLVAAGQNRISVARNAIKQIIADNYDKFNLGLATFSTSSGGGAYIRKKITQQNLGTGNTLEAFNTAIDNISHGGGTPLAIALADLWSYFKGTYKTNYNYNNGTQTLDTDLPIAYWCQSNYVILMTDGESNTDRFAASRFNNSLFKSNPDHVDENDNGGWGVLDGHDYNANDYDNGNWYNNSVPDYCLGGSCWNLGAGCDYLDDIAFLMYNNDLFPDSAYTHVPALTTDMPNKQKVETFTIGFAANNNLLSNTAEYGNAAKAEGAYKTANNYNELLNAIQQIIENMTIREFGFSAFTAPKKVTSTQGAGSSFIGFFKPKDDNAIWEGHLQSYKLDKWCPDLNDDGIGECTNFYTSETDCESASSSNGKPCIRETELASNPDWDTATVSKNSRALYTHNSANLSAPYDLINFTDVANISTLDTLFGTADVTKAQTIVNKISAIVTVKINGVDTPVIQLGDIFHSDIAYVGPPIPGKKYLTNLNPPECGTNPAILQKDDTRCFENLLKTQGATTGVDGSGRKKVVYVGSNDGILHQIDAVNGNELWGFIPDEVLPSLKKIAIDNEYAFTVDGRLTAEDIYFRGTSNIWKTILAFGLKDGGNSYYAFDVTSVDSTPHLLWKFPKGSAYNDTKYSGKSWGKPIIGKIKYWDTATSKNIDKWVVVLSGGFAFNNENPNDLQGKAVFVIDASSGELVWMIGYKPTGVTNPGVADNANTAEIDTVKDNSVTTGLRYLTAKGEFNYAIPSALTVIDRDGNGYLDSIYFGNVAGHLLKTDISNVNPAYWKTYLLFKHDLSTYIASATVSGVSGTEVTLNTSSITGTFAENHNVFAINGTNSSHAMGIVTGVDSVNSKLTIAYTPSSGCSFIVNDTVVIPKFDPIFLSPAIFFDSCNNLWVAFGTGDRLRSRTNPTSGKFVALRDGTTLVSSVQTQKTNIITSDLVTLTWTTADKITTAAGANNIKVTGKWGWYFIFHDYLKNEKMFDPEPLVLPGANKVSHIYFNTYQPATIITTADCNAPAEGNMKFYDLTLNYCGTGGTGTIEGSREYGRIAGGGAVDKGTFWLPIGGSNVASIPPLKDNRSPKLDYSEGMLFWREKKR